MPQSNFTNLIVKVAGTENPDLAVDIDEVVVETTFNLPSMATIRIHDPEMTWVDDASLDLGKEVEIEIEPSVETGGTTKGKVFAGEIVALEPVFSAQGEHVLVLRAYDKSHRLHIGRKFQTYMNQSDSDIVKAIGGAAGLTVESDTTQPKHEYVLQNNQTDMEFLVARARRLGFQLLLAAGKLQFKKVPKVATGTELILADNLRQFRPRLSAARQPKKFEVRGWDYMAKAAIAGNTNSGQVFTNGYGGKDGGAASSVFGSEGTAYLVDTGPADKSEADSIAYGLAVDADGDYIEAEGICYGDPSIQAGTSVTVKEVGTRFSGNYVVTSAIHIYNVKGYEVHFTVSGRMPNSLNYLLEPKTTAGADDGRIYGVVVGIVDNLKDPKELGRIKVKYNWMGPDSKNVEIVSHWARLAAPAAGKTRGFYYIPEVEDEVLVAFEQGDPGRPYIVGMLWNGKDTPPEKNTEAIDSGGKMVNHRILQSRLGHKIVFDDSSDKTSILVQDKTGKQMIHIDSTKNNITITADGDLIVDVKGNIKMTAGQKIEMNATSDITQTTKANYKVDATGNADLSAKAQMSMTGTAGLSAESPAQTQVKGGMVDVNATGNVTVKGVAIMLN